MIRAPYAHQGTWGAITNHLLVPPYNSIYHLTYHPTYHHPHRPTRYVNQNSWSKVAKGFFKQQDEFVVIKESNLKEAEKKYITDVCDPRKVIKTEFNEATGKFVRQPLFATYASEAEKEFLWQSYNSRTAADVDRRRSDQELWADKRMGSAKLMDPNCTFTPDLKDLSENNAPHLQVSY